MVATPSILLRRFGCTTLFTFIFAAVSARADQVATPTFSPAAGTYASTQSVIISSTTSGATIRYTTDGSTPTETNGTIYSSPVSVDGIVVLTAIAFEAGFTDSPVTNSVYVIQHAGAPLFSPAPGGYTGPKAVTILSSTSGITIRYTTDGSTPTETDGTIYNYGDSVTITSTTTLQAIAYGAGYADSTVTTGIYTINSAQAAAPTFSPPAGSYSSAQSVTISSTTSSASIAYTTDGTTPAESGGTITHGLSLSNGGLVSVNSNTTINAIAFENGFTDSTVANATYIFSQTAMPTFSPAAGTYNSLFSVTLNSATSGASFVFTSDGTTPTEDNGHPTGTSQLYSGPIPIGFSTTLKAVAFKGGSFADSDVATAMYTILQVDPPTFSLPAGAFHIYNTIQSVTITSATSGASIAYTTDGTVPTESGGTVTHGTLLSNGGAVSLDSVTNLEAIAFKSGLADAFASAIYFVELPNAASPVLTPGAGTYTSAQSVTIVSATSGASIAYTTDGTTPTATTGGVLTHGALLSNGGSIPISSTTTLNVIAFKNDFSPSFPVAATYTLPPPAPTFSPPAGTYTSAQSVSITPSIVGATVRYTTDGSTPTETTGTIYSGPVNVGSTKILKAIAYKTGFLDSLMVSGIYTINSPAVILNIIRDFAAPNNGGINPIAGLVQGNDGNFYGTTFSGGSSNNGTVFKVTPAGTLTTLASFTGTNGSQPTAALIQGSDGNFYGTTSNGGSSSNGTVFKMTPAGVLSTLVSFNGTNGSLPTAALVQGSDGNFYGTTAGGGSSQVGTIFKMTPAGVLTTLASFNGLNGGVPAAALVQGNDGNFYSTTYAGGSAADDGVVFKVTPTGALTTLAVFTGANGASPVAGLVQGNDGNFYGATDGDSVNNQGTIFKITPSGNLTTLAVFNGTNGAQPSGSLVQGSDGNFYGTTEEGGAIGVNDGTIFKVTPTGALTTLVSFDGANGIDPAGSLIQGSDGNFYGTTDDGGNNGEGVIFQLIVPFATSAPTFSPTPGTYASTQTVTITSATSGATIRYTTNGSTPTETNGTIYSGPISISTNATLAAVAYKAGFTDSSVTNGTYTIASAVAPASPTNTSGDAGGGGGGAPSWWFLGVLAFAGIMRWKFFKTQA